MSHPFCHGFLFAMASIFSDRGFLTCASVLRLRPSSCAESSLNWLSIFSTILFSQSGSTDSMTSNWLVCTNKTYIVVALHLADFCRYSNQDQSKLTMVQNTKLAGSVQIYALVNNKNNDSHKQILSNAQKLKNNCANRLIKKGRQNAEQSN